MLLPLQECRRRPVLTDRRTRQFAGSGTDSDGSIVSYEWLQLGPSNNVFSSVNTANTNLSNLVEGVYVFELTVQDNKGATGRTS